MEFLTAASALAAVLLYGYVDVGTIGPPPDMHEPTWQVPGKLLSRYAEAAAAVGATIGLAVPRPARRRGAGRANRLTAVLTDLLLHPRGSGEAATRREGRLLS